MKVCGKDILISGRLLKIGTPELDSYENLDAPDALMQQLVSSGSRVDIFTFLQSVPDVAPKYAYPMELDNLAVLPVSTFEHWWEHRIKSYPRNRARQAQKKGVVLREVPFDDYLVHGMWEVYNESPIRQGKPNVHYGKSLDTVHREEATFLDRSIFVAAIFEEKVIGFAKLVTDGIGMQANLMNIVSMVKHRDKAVTNALISEAVRSCAARGIRYLLYQNHTYGNKKADSLTHFKETNGFQRIELPRYYIPLTALGSIAVRLRLYRRWTELIPDSIGSRLRDLRATWYRRTLHQSETEMS